MRILVLSATLDQASFERVIEAGTAGVVDKLAGVDEIIEMMRRIDAGEAKLRQREVVELLRRFDRRLGPGASLRTLTASELEVLRALAEGLDSEAVAARLGMAPEEERASSILEKLEARSRLQALAIAAGDGIVDIP